jgi:thiamine pyrophosphokinase
MNTDQILILLDGEEPSKEFVSHFLSLVDVVIATDGAARYAKQMDVPLDVIIGDLDSLDEDTFNYYQGKDVAIIKDPSQYSNDFEKALDHAIKEYMPKQISVLGIHGKRTDHLLTNFSVLLRYSKIFGDIDVYDATHRHFFLHEKNTKAVIDADIQSQLSLTPMPIAYGVTTEGLFYPINDEEMKFGDREGLSNIISSSPVSVSISSGSLLVSIPYSVG